MPAFKAMKLPLQEDCIGYGFSNLVSLPLCRAAWKINKCMIVHENFRQITVEHFSEKELRNKTNEIG